MRPKTALLHIGTWKTGTTSIQRWLANAQGDGSLAPVRYPLWGEDHNHHRLLSLYRPHEDLPPDLRHKYGPSGKSYRRMCERYRDFLFDDLRAATGVILSHESLCDFSPLLAAHLREDLESLGFQEFHVVLYVRDPADFFLSATQQDVKGAFRSPVIQDPANYRYEFLRMAETWERAFPGRLIIRKFPTDQGHDIIDDFAVVMQQCFGTAPPKIPLRMNTTHSAEAMKILQDYRLTFESGTEIPMPDVARLREFLNWSRQRVPQTKPVLKQEVAEQIRANHKEDAEAIYSRYGVDLGLQNCGRATTVSRGKPYRVDEILESVNPEVVDELLLLLARIHLGPKPKQSLPWRIAAWAYRRIPPGRRPVRAASWVRSRINQENRWTRSIASP